MGYKGFGAIQQPHPIILHPHNRRSPSPPEPRLEAYSHSKVPISNSDFDGGDKDPDGASPKYAYCAFILLFSFSYVPLRERPYTRMNGDAREGLVAHVQCSSELLAAAREGEPLELLKQSPGPVFGSCIE
ncbi:hypothetical protein CXB51_018371 [Gossypium anomalum]|uniref:Uncharacterized protein n=1 Tax=Gossypium anomalum TaxID=47600 RepID=A0A8J6CUV2_9ROSI|nr:hypothetical protein CXB51_018371 [Gossypium anomalum]